MLPCSVVLRFGLSAESICWAVLFLLAPISCIYYPVGVLPAWLQPFALAVPATHVFEGMRSVINGGPFPVREFLWSSGLNVLYLAGNHGRHMSAEDIYRALIDQSEDIGLATVYRVLTQFEAAALVKRHHFEGGTAVFELNEGRHHDHLVCTRCSGVVEIEECVMAELEQRIARVEQVCREHDLEVVQDGRGNISVRHREQLDEDGQRRLYTNPLRVLDTKNPLLHPIMEAAPRLRAIMSPVIGACCCCWARAEVASEARRHPTTKAPPAAQWRD